MLTVIYYSEARDENFTQDQLEAMNLTELKDLFNEEARATAKNPGMFKPIAKFSDKANAIRRVTAVLTAITNIDDDTDDTNEQSARIEDHVNNADDPRLDIVTCTTCGHTAEKHTMTLVGSNWYCMDEDECEARLNPNTDPNEHNAPEGMVYCGLCKRHVPVDTAEPTADAGIYTCKELCIGKNASSLRDKARSAANGANTEPKVPKAKSERKVKYPADHVIHHVKTRTCRGFSLVAYSTLTEGMTVKEACEAIAKLETGAITGLSEINYDVSNGYITVTAPNTTNQPA